MIHLDTSFLIASLRSGTPENGRVMAWLAAGEQVALSVIVWAEFLCGPVTPEHAAHAAAAFPDPVALVRDDASRAAELFNATGRRRGSLADCMIAATCLRLGAAVATSNLDGFRRFESMGLRVL